MAVVKRFGVKSYGQSEEDVFEIIDKYGVGTVVVESRDVVGLPEFGMLYQALEGERFRLLKEFPLTTNIEDLKVETIRVFEYLYRKEVEGGIVIIPMPHPSPRNIFWLKRNPWFEAEVIPALQQRVKEIILT